MTRKQARELAAALSDRQLAEILYQLDKDAGNNGAALRDVYSRAKMRGLARIARADSARKGLRRHLQNGGRLSTWES